MDDGGRRRTPVDAAMESKLPIMGIRTEFEVGFNLAARSQVVFFPEESSAFCEGSGCRILP